MAAMPTHTDPLPDAPSVHAASDGIDHASYFMARNPWKLQTRPLPLLGQRITVANSASLNLDADLALARFTNLQLDKLQWAPCCFHLYSLHPGHELHLGSHRCVGMPRGDLL
jgi:hypothetical protein